MPAEDPNEPEGREVRRERREPRPPRQLPDYTVDELINMPKPQRKKLRQRAVKAGLPKPLIPPSIYAQYQAERRGDGKGDGQDGEPKATGSEGAAASSKVPPKPSTSGEGKGSFKLKAPTSGALSSATEEDPSDSMDTGDAGSTTESASSATTPKEETSVDFCKAVAAQPKMHTNYDLRRASARLNGLMLRASADDWRIYNGWSKIIKKEQDLRLSSTLPPQGRKDQGKGAK